mmetsp:Transcript_101117/g.325695  ORF Transcript_101117/g.325695 Transcript_101117/m.325695 type:complete len:320 (-) Transcript_101117:158-1117(-)
MATAATEFDRMGVEAPQAMDAVGEGKDRRARYSALRSALGVARTAAADDWWENTEALQALVEGKEVALVIDAGSADLDVLFRTESWLALTQGKETSLLNQFGPEAFEHFGKWLPRFLDHATASGWSRQNSRAMYQKMVLLAPDDTWNNVRFMVHLPASSASAGAGVVRPLVLSMERFRPVKQPLTQKESLGTIVERPGEEDAEARELLLRRSPDSYGFVASIDFGSEATSTTQSDSTESSSCFSSSSSSPGFSGSRFGAATEGRDRAAGCGVSHAADPFCLRGGGACGKERMIAWPTKDELKPLWQASGARQGRLIVSL